MRKCVLALLACALAQAAPINCAPATLQDYLNLDVAGCAIQDAVFNNFAYDVFAGTPGFNTPSAADITVTPVSLPGQVGFLFSSYLWYAGPGDTTQARLGYQASTPGAFTGTQLTWGDLALNGLNSQAQIGIDIPGGASFVIEAGSSLFMTGDGMAFLAGLSSLTVDNYLQLAADNASLLDSASFGWFQETFSLEAGGAVPEPLSAVLIGSGLIGLGLLSSRRARRRGLPILIAAAAAGGAAQAATQVSISGEIETIILTNPADVWSDGQIVVGGQVVILPRNLLLDLPANRLTLQQLFAQAPAACVANGESGLAKGDKCNASGAGGYATISANRMATGNVIAGDVFIQKGVESVSGTVTYINHTDGYFRLNGNPGDAATGVMVRLNDPGSRHTVQQGLGCAGGPNCSSDPRFTLDPDNYTNTFATGYPLCLASTVPRSFVDTLDFDRDGNRTETLTAQAAADGSGDLLCPTTNRAAPGFPVDDSRRMAPIMLGDSVTAEGNFEVVNGVRFVSTHTIMVHRALITRRDPGQPDYLFLDEVEIDSPAFQNERARTLFIGFSTLAPSDVVIWGLHRDPQTNSPHELPLASVLGCDNAAGPGTCGQQGLVGAGANIFKIRHDVDFILGASGPPARPRLSPCAHLRSDPRFINSNICPQGGTFAEEFAILSPIPHEIIARTGKKIAEGAALVTLDINGNEATNGTYLFPLGMNLGGISVPEMVEINLDALDTAYFFSGIPWNLDRRLSPNGCNGACESTPQPLNPFPFETLDPRLQAQLPTGSYSDPNYTSSTLADVRNRIFSYVNGTGKFDGNNTVLAWPPPTPGALPITPTPALALACALPPLADTTAPTVPAGVTATLSAGAVVVSWTASTDNIGVTGYDILRNGASIGTATATTFTDSAPPIGVALVYSVTATDAAGNVSAAGAAPALTIADTAAPAAPAGVTATLSAGSVVVSWTASTDNVAVTGYNILRNGTAIGTSTATTFTDAAPPAGAALTYSVVAFDSAGNQSPAGAATPLTITDTTAPTAPTGVTATISAGTVIVGWTAATDNVAVTGYRVLRNGANLATLPGSATSFTDTAPPPGIALTYSVVALDAAGNASPAGTATAVTVADTAAPSVPTGLTASRLGAGVVLSWTASTDNVGVTGYGVYRDGALVTTVTVTTWTDPNPATGAHTYAVDAVDAAGNRSAQTAAINVTIGDTAAPTAPASVSATVNATGVAVSWTAATDNVGVAGYGVYRDNVLIATVTAGTTHTDPNTTPGTYTYSVDAFDAAANRSARTSAAPVTIDAPVSGPAVNPPTSNFLLRQPFNGNAVIGVSWSLVVNSAVSRFELQQTADAGATWTPVPTATLLSTTASVTLPPGSYQFRVRAFDTAGNPGPWAAGLPFTLSAVDGDAGNVSLVTAPAGAWATQTGVDALGGSVQHSATTNATATYTFTVPAGARIAYVATTGPDRGNASVAIDGSVVSLVSLFSQTVSSQTLFRSNPLAAGTHTIRITVLGTKQAASTGFRVDVDGFLMMQ